MPACGVDTICPPSSPNGGPPDITIIVYPPPDEDVQVDLDFLHNTRQCPNCANIINGANQMVYVGAGIAAVEAAPAVAIEASVAAGPVLDAANESLATTSIGIQAMQFAQGVISALVPGSTGAPPTPAGMTGYLVGKIAIIMGKL